MEYYHCIPCFTEELIPIIRFGRRERREHCYLCRVEISQGTRLCMECSARLELCIFCSHPIRGGRITADYLTVKSMSENSGAVAKEKGLEELKQIVKGKSRSEILELSKKYAGVI